MNNFIEIATGIDVAPVLADLERHPEHWGAIANRTYQPESPHHESDDIWIRYADIRPAIASGDWSIMRQPIAEFIWYPAFDDLPALDPIIGDLFHKVDGTRLGGMWITRLKPGKRIKRHADFGWHCDTFDKYYVPLQADAGAVFGCERSGVTEEIETRPGSAWLMDNHYPHWVHNGSQRDRMMLIVCIETDRFNEFHGRT